MEIFRIISGLWFIRHLFIWKSDLSNERLRNRSATFNFIDTFSCDIWYIWQVLREQMTSDKSEPTVLFVTYITYSTMWTKCSSWIQQCNDVQIAGLRQWTPTHSLLGKCANTASCLQFCLIVAQHVSLFACYIEPIVIHIIAICVNWIS